MRCDIPGTAWDLTYLAGMTPDDLNEMHREIRAGQRGCVEKAIDLGRALAHVREGLPHGAWLPWVKKNLAFGDETARNYMAMAEHSELAGRCTSIRQFLRRIRFRRHVENRRQAAERGRALHAPNWCHLYETDFRRMPDLLPPSCASLCVADPVWGDDLTHDYADIDAVASELLKPGGALLVYYSRNRLPEVLASFRALRFLDQLFVVYTAPKQLWTAGGMVCRTRPVLLFVKGDSPTKSTFQMHDTRLGTVAPPRDYHRWEQDEPAVRYWVERFTDPGDTVVDLFVGGGTLAASCHHLKGRTYHGSDTDPEALAATRKRLTDLEAGEADADLRRAGDGGKLAGVPARFAGVAPKR